MAREPYNLQKSTFKYMYCGNWTTATALLILYILKLQIQWPSNSEISAHWPQSTWVACMLLVLHWKQLLWVGFPNYMPQVKYQGNLWELAVYGFSVFLSRLMHNYYYYYHYSFTAIKKDNLC